MQVMRADAIKGASEGWLRTKANDFSAKMFQTSRPRDTVGKTSTSFGIKQNPSFTQLNYIYRIFLNLALFKR